MSKTAQTDLTIVPSVVVPASRMWLTPRRYVGYRTDTVIKCAPT